LSNQFSDMQIADLLQLAVLRPPSKQGLLFHVEFLPGWWNESIGRQLDGGIEIASEFLRDFVSTTGVWQGELDSTERSAPFAMESKSGQLQQLQALAAQQSGNRVLLIQNLSVTDDWIVSTLRRARSNMLQQAKDSSSHRRTVATITADRDEAQRMDKLKSEFLANMSHEIRTPLTTILGMASIAQNTPGHASKYMDGIASAANRLLKLSNDILDLSKIQVNRMELELEAFELRAMLEEFEQEWQLRVKPRSLSFQLEVADSVPETVVGDPFRLRQVLTNLVGNAVKFTETGGVSVMVAMVPGRLDRIRFEVNDSGVGIEEHQIATIFDTFTQVDISSERRRQGAGLGLPIASRLIELMGGQIEVESIPSMGSTFRFEADLLPVASDATKSTVQPETGTRDSDPALLSSRNSGVRVLVAEDHDLNRSIIVETLQEFGFQTFEAENGQVAVQEWRQRKVDVVLMDCQMPVLSGLEAIKMIRDEEQPNEHVPIIALTAHAMQDHRQRLLDRGADRYVSKPFDREQLVELIAELAGV